MKKTQNKQSIKPLGIHCLFCVF